MTLQNPHTGPPACLGRQSRLDGGHGIELLITHQLHGLRRVLSPHQLGMLQLTAEEQVIRASRRHRNPNALPVHILDPANRRAGRDHVRSFQLDVGGGEIDVLAANRVYGQEGEIPNVVSRAGRDLSGSVDGDHLQSNAHPPGQLPRQIDRKAGGWAFDCR